MKSCPTCASPVDENATVCPDCGMDLSAAFTSSPDVPSPETDEIWAAEEVPSAPSVMATPVATSTATLTLQRGGMMAETFALTTEAVVGRFDAASGPVDVDLSGLPEAGWVSRRHARLFCTSDGRWKIQDLGSSNGTFVRSNGRGAFRRVSPEGEEILRAGDEIALGNARFLFLVNN